MRILIGKAATLSSNPVFRFDGVAHHRCEKSQILELRPIVTIGNEAKIEAERTDSSAFHGNRNTNMCEFLSGKIALAKALREHRFLAELRHHDGLTCFDNSALNAFAD